MPFWIELLEKYGGPVLELGCGTGKITIPIAEAGFEVTGIDLSENMLEHAQNKVSDGRLSAQFLHANMTNFTLGRKFKTIVLPSNNLAHLMDYREAGKCFSSVYEHLEEDGVFIIDAFVPSLAILTKSPEHEEVLSKYADPDGHGEVEVVARAVYETDTQVRRAKTFQRIPNKATIEGHLNMRMYFPQELEALLYHCNFEIVNKYGSYSKEPFSSKSIKQLIVAKKS